MSLRAAWLFEEHGDGTLYRAAQLVDTAVARCLAVAGWSRARRSLGRWLDRLTIRTMLPRCTAVFWHPVLPTTHRCERSRIHLGRHRAQRMVTTSTWPLAGRFDIVRWSR